MTDPVAAQYEAYPYPARDPADEAKRLITGSPGHLDELTHILFAGRIAQRPFRVLVAGGGTGDGLVMLAQQAADRGVEAEITYLDLSGPARAIAERRLAARSLSGVRFITGSLLDAATLAPGPFDYIDCCGVLHHLADPDAGLAALASVLAPGGGMGVMVYAPYGRTGVYPLQSALRRMAGDGAPEDRVALARRMVDALPETNWFRRNPFLGDHRASDAGLYDLLLHSRDRAFSFPELAAWISRAGLTIAGVPIPAALDPDIYIADPALRRSFADLSPDDRAALAEEISGAIKTHAVYLVRRDEAAGRLATPGPDMIPVLRNGNGPALAAGLKPGRSLGLDVNGVTLRPALPRLAAAMLQRIDGARSLRGLCDEIIALRPDLDEAAFERQFMALYEPLNRFGLMFLRKAG